MAFNLGSYYKINCKISGKVFDVRDESLNNGAYIQQYTWKNIDGQKFMVYPLDNGTYAFASKLSGKVFSVRAASMDNQAVIEQYDWSAEDKQKFYLTLQEANYYSGTSQLSGKVWDVRDSSTHNQALIQQYTWKDIDGQKFSFTPVDTISVPSTTTTPLPGVPEYHGYNDQLPDQTYPVVTAYTVAPFFAISDPRYGTNTARQVKENPYYLYIRKEYWKLLQSHTFAPGEDATFVYRTGISTVDQTASSTTTSTTIGADGGLQFKKLSVGLSSQYTTELQTSQSTTDAEMKEQEVAITLTNIHPYPVAWSKYILVREYHVERSDGSIVNTPWTVSLPNRTQSVYYPNEEMLRRPVLIEFENYSL
ncbi:RICIN domain-containing protein [Bacillus cereus]|uniref:Insecticidal toxin n=1 Tax=Bacillus cereus TaxID=1396 RepID=A0A9X6X6B6_BACCE|nr:RICIN domain-containing protein [Bacillus cereus]PFK27907.1 insecticidal toxin [Bacillus cereus]